MNCHDTTFTRILMPNSFSGFTFLARRTVRIGAVAGVMVGAGFVHASTVFTVNSFDYDTVTGALKKTVVEPGDSKLCVVTEYTPDAYGHPKITTIRNCSGALATAAGSPAEAPEPVGMGRFPQRTVENFYEADQRFVEKTTNALLQEEKKTYDRRFGKLASHTDVNQLTTTWAYDGLGRKKLETRPDGTHTKWTYVVCSYEGDRDWKAVEHLIPAGAATAICERVPAAFKKGSTNVGPAQATPIYYVQATPLKPDGVTPNGPYTRVYYDSLGREIRTETQGSDVSGISQLVYKDLAYDFVGDPIVKTLPYAAGGTSRYVADYTYDLLGRVTRVYEADAAGGPASTWTTYSGLVTTTEDPKGNKTTQIKNAVGLVATITNAKGESITRAYDPLGNVARATDALGNVTSLEYDKRGRKTAMYDPDMGVWGYCYDALGQLKAQQDPNARGGNTLPECPAVPDVGLTASPVAGWSTMAYDVLGRMTQRTESDLKSTWTYDACSKGVGKLCVAVADNGYSRTHGYDSLGRPSTLAAVRNATTYTSRVAYDPASGRVNAQTYPTGLTVNPVYSSLGYLSAMVDARNGQELWKALAQDAQGHYRQVRLGNGLVTTNEYFGDGRLNTTKTGPGDSVQNLSYVYDLNRNVSARVDLGTGVTASYGYDAIDRLTSERRSGGSLGAAQEIRWDYDQIGNIYVRTERGDTNTYLYNTSGLGSLRPHAVAGVSGSVNAALAPVYRYDANGNLTTGAGRTTTWTASNMVKTVSAGNAGLRFNYSPERERFEEIYSRNGADQRATVYISSAGGEGLFFEEETGPAGTKIKHYVRAGGATVAMIQCAASPCTALGNTSTQYWHDDHLGSVSAVTNSFGAVLERMAYEPFGKRRNADGVADVNGTLVPSSTDRGFTEHEHMDEVGLINMNGRVYDAALGRFLSADPTIPDADNLQSYNRYSYTFNRPLAMTDPSGFDPYWGAGASISYSGGDWGLSYGASSAGAFAGAYYPVASYSSLNGFSMGGGAGVGFSTLGGNLEGYSKGVRALDSSLQAENEAGKSARDFRLAFERARSLGDVEGMEDVYRAYRESAGLNPSSQGRLTFWGNVILRTRLDAGLEISGSVLSTTVAAASVMAVTTNPGGPGPGAGRGGAETTRVGRWMSPAEFRAMVETGRVVEGAGGRTYVVNPPNPGSFTSAGKGSSVYAEFDVPTSVLRQGSKPEWSVIPGPNVTTRLYGPPPKESAPATCIVCVIGKP